MSWQDNTPTGSFSTQGRDASTRSHGYCPHCPHCNGLPFHAIPVNNGGAWTGIGGLLSWLWNGTQPQQSGPEDSMNVGLNMSSPYAHSRAPRVCPRCHYNLAASPDTPASWVGATQTSEKSTTQPPARDLAQFPYEPLDNNFMEQLQYHLLYLTDAEVIEIVLAMCLLSPEVHRTCEKALLRVESEMKQRTLHGEEGVHIRLQQYNRAALKEHLGYICWEVPQIQHRVKRAVQAIRRKKESRHAWTRVE